MRSGTRPQLRHVLWATSCATGMMLFPHNLQHAIGIQHLFFGPALCLHDGKARTAKQNMSFLQNGLTLEVRDASMCWFAVGSTVACSPCVAKRQWVVFFFSKIVSTVAGALTIRDNNEAAVVRVLRRLQHSNARTTQQSDVL